MSYGSEMTIFLRKENTIQSLFAQLTSSQLVTTISVVIRGVACGSWLMCADLSLVGQSSEGSGAQSQNRQEEI